MPSLHNGAGEEDPWWQGHDAGLAGKPRHCNPHDPGTPEWKEWDHGWKNAFALATG